MESAVNILLFLRQFFRYWLCAAFKRPGFPHRKVMILLLMTPYIVEAQLNHVDIYLDNKPLLRVTYKNNDTGGASAVPQQQVVISPHPDFEHQHEPFSSREELHQRRISEKSWIFKVPFVSIFAEIAQAMEEKPHGFGTDLPIEHTESDINGLAHLAGQLQHLNQTMVFMPTSNPGVMQINSSLFSQSGHSVSDSLYVWIFSEAINFNTWQNFFQNFQFSQDFLAVLNPLTIFMMPPFSGMLTQASWFGYLEMHSFALCSDTSTTLAETQGNSVVTYVPWVNVNNVTYIAQGNQLQMHIYSQSRANRPIAIHIGSRCITSYTQEELDGYIANYSRDRKPGEQGVIKLVIRTKEEDDGSKKVFHF